MPPFEVFRFEGGGVAPAAEGLELEQPGSSNLTSHLGILATGFQVLQMLLNHHGRSGDSWDEPDGTRAPIHVGKFGRIAWWN